MSGHDIGVMVVFEEADRLRGMMTERFPEVRFAFASRPEDVCPMLDDVQPHVVLGIKSPEFPGRHHRAALEFPSVKWFSVGGSGYDHLLPWPQKDVVITNAAGVLARFLAESVTAAMLMINGNFPLYAVRQREKSWRSTAFEPIAGKTLLIAGVGAIGGCVADNAKALGMRVIGTRRSGASHPSVDEVHDPGALASLLPQADFISLHVRLSNETRHMIDAGAIDLMKPDTVFINTARGGVVDEVALTDALRHGRLKAAYLDVFETEPLPEDSPLWSMDNVVLTPHASDNVTEWPERFTEKFMDNLDRWIAGETLENTVST